MAAIVHRTNVDPEMAKFGIVYGDAMLLGVVSQVPSPAAFLTPQGGSLANLVLGLLEALNAVFTIT